MLIKFQITLALFFSVVSAFAQPKDTIYGNVKSIREKVIFLDSTKQQIKFLSIDGDYGHSGFTNPKWISDRFSQQWYNSPWVHYINYHKEFNKKGKVTNETWFYKNKDTVTNYKYVYDSKKNLIQIKTRFFDDEFGVRNFSYNSKNKVKTSMYYATDQPDEYLYRVYTYDTLSNLIEVKTFNETGESSSWIYEYDIKKRKISEKTHKPYVYVKTKTGGKYVNDKIGSLRLYKKFIYDKEGQMIENQTFNTSLDVIQSTNPQSRVRNIYKNSLLKEAQYLRDKLIHSTHYFYDNNKRLIKKIKTREKNTEYNELLEYTYNEKGNIVKLIYSEDDWTKVIEFKYIHDDNGNWIQQTKSVDGEDLYVWTREIEFHN